MPTPIKIIVACKDRLQLKYGSKFSKITPLLKKLTAEDKKRGIATSIWFIDDAESSKALQLKAVKKTTPKDCKASIDALYAKHAPDYIVILGAQDAFPFQELDNPTDDEDLKVPSDLPYACEHPFSTDPADFLGPTRVVGRLPDIPEVSDINYLTKLINTASTYQQLPSKKYGGFFAVSAKVWEKSTQASLMATFGGHKGMKLSPNAAPSGGYTNKEFASLAHFYNCHGAMDDPHFFGQKTDTSNDFPVALFAGNLTGNIADGTVVAAECCYGANMFNPANVTTDGTPSIANNYLGHGALSFLGSSTIAYGPAEGQGQADYITQFFVINVLRGASAGRALLEARQSFLTKTGPNLDPVDLKTIAQFYLLGDPSIAPVQAAAKAKTAETATAKGPQRFGAARMVTETANTVQNRRRNLLIKGLNLSTTLAAPKKISSSNDEEVSSKKAGPMRAGATRAKQAPSEKDKNLAAVLQQSGFQDFNVSSTYESESPVQAPMRAGAAKGMLEQKTQFRTYTKLRKETPAGAMHAERTVKAPEISRNQILVVKENEDAILRWRVYEAR